MQRTRQIDPLVASRALYRPLNHYFSNPVSRSLFTTSSSRFPRRHTPPPWFSELPQPHIPKALRGSKLAQDLLAAKPPPDPFDEAFKKVIDPINAKKKTKKKKRKKTSGRASFSKASQTREIPKFEPNKERDPFEAAMAKAISGVKSLKMARQTAKSAKSGVSWEVALRSQDVAEETAGSKQGKLVAGKTGKKTAKQTAGSKTEEWAGAKLRGNAASGAAAKASWGAAWEPSTKSVNKIKNSEPFNTIRANPQASDADAEAETKTGADFVEELKARAASVPKPAPGNMPPAPPTIWSSEKPGKVDRIEEEEDVEVSDEMQSDESLEDSESKKSSLEVVFNAEEDEIGENPLVRLWRSTSLVIPPESAAETRKPHHPSVLKAASEFFGDARHKPRLLYKTDDFYSHEANETVPEIVVLGCSNVGKSTFLNGLFGARELARSSGKPGFTRSVFAYGAGPPKLLKVEPVPMRTNMLGPPPKHIPQPRHGLIVHDTPGYGYQSRSEWGKHLQLYLGKRRLLRGAVILIPCQSDRKVPSHGDQLAMKLVAEAGVPMMIVLARADRAGKSWISVSETVADRVHKEIKKLEGKLVSAPDVYVTAAGMSHNNQSKLAIGPYKGPKQTWSDKAGMAGVRYAILRMAGVEGFTADTPKRRWRERTDGGPKTAAEIETRRVVHRQDGPEGEDAEDADETADGIPSADKAPMTIGDADLTAFASHDEIVPYDQILSGARRNKVNKDDEDDEDDENGDGHEDEAESEDADNFQFSPSDEHPSAARTRKKDAKKGNRRNGVQAPKKKRSGASDDLVQGNYNKRTRDDQPFVGKIF